jgi:hypothetical protein
MQNLILVDKTSGIGVTYLYWEATYVMLFLCYPIAINLHFFSLLDTWLSQPELPSRHPKRFSRNNACRGGHRGVHLARL